MFSVSRWRYVGLLKIEVIWRRSLEVDLGWVIEQVPFSELDRAIEDLRGHVQRPVGTEVHSHVREKRSWSVAGPSTHLLAGPVMRRQGGGVGSGSGRIAVRVRESRRGLSAPDP